MPSTSLGATLRRFEQHTRPTPPELAAALEQRWRDLPEHVKTPTQMLGRRTSGCEGTHGVFPRCNLACTPCYHAKEANRVRTDGAHTVQEVDRQMAYLNQQRGPGQNAQLIGGEVSLLPPDDHAAALQAMRRHGRKPMSMSHGDFDYDYLEAMAVGPDGNARFDFLSFAGHFDSMMFGRRGIKRVEREPQLNPHRKAFCDMFHRLQREYGIDNYLAHNMTVTPRNLDQVPQLIRDCRDYGFRMFSFQPAAFIGNTNRWKDSYRAFTDDEVWAKIEEGIGARLPFRVLQIGDERCNRTAYGGMVGERWVPLLDDRDPADHAARDAFVKTFGGMDFAAPRPVTALRTVRALAANPAVLGTGVRWAGRFVRRAGARNLLRHGFRALTFVQHNFMDAELVKPAWKGLREGTMSDDPQVRATQERLQACSYAMAHPDSDELVPACAQHSVLDPEENLRLTELLPVGGDDDADAPLATAAPLGRSALPLA
ncbi:MAG: radical SAM domain-containing protein [Solirubrobacterales bacterium]